MLPGLRDSQGRIIANSGAVLPNSPYWRGVAVSPDSEVYIDAVSDPSLTLNLDFLNSGPLDSRITFTRTSTATYMGADGLLHEAAVDEPRFEYDSNGNPLGLLIEGSRTNEMLQSATLQGYILTPATGLDYTPDAGIAPDGTVSAGKWANTTTTEQHRLFASTASVGVTTSYIYAKADSGQWIQLSMNQADGNLLFANFDLTDGVIGSFGAIGAAGKQSIIPIGDGWYRCSLTGTGDTNNVQIYVLEQDVPQANPVFAGTGKSVFMWGAQLEVGPSASSYIPTTDAAVTRAADNASMTGTNFSDWYNQAEGSFAAQVFNSGQWTNPSGAGIIGSTTLGTRPLVKAQNQYNDGVQSGYNTFVAVLWRLDEQPVVGINKYACRATLTDCAVTMNGLPIQSVTGAAHTPLADILIGLSGGLYMFGHIQRVMYWNRLLSDAEMIEITGGARTRQYPTTVEGALQIEVDGIPASYQGGIAYTADRRICAKLNAVPDATDRYLAGVRVTPEGLVHFVTNALPLNSAWSTGFSSGFGNGP